MDNRSKGMNRVLAVALVGALVGGVAGCGGGGDPDPELPGIPGTPTRPTPSIPPTPPTPSVAYGGAAWGLGDECSGAAWNFVTGRSSATDAEYVALVGCQEEAARRGGFGCEAAPFSQCAVIAYGTTSDECYINAVEDSTVGGATSDALQLCRNSLGSGNNCTIVKSGCASGSVSTAPAPTRPGPTRPTTDYFGAVAVENGRGRPPQNCARRGAGIAVDYTTNSDAESFALSECRRRGGTNCIPVLNWSNGCAAYAAGSQCGWGGGYGGDLDTARNNALSRCQQQDSGCQVQLSACTTR